MVILLLGILAAVGLPRFLSNYDSASAARLKGIAECERVFRVMTQTSETVTRSANTSVDPRYPSLVYTPEDGRVVVANPP